VELIGGLEDVRRFDMALVISSLQINSKEINKLNRHRPKKEHVYTNALCQKCILWAWTRTANQIIIDDETIQVCLDKAIHLCDRYTEAVPLIDQGTIRYKLARLAIALAARTFSERDGCIVVLPCHIEFIAKWLDEQYSKKEFGYQDLTRSVNFQRKLVDPEGIKKSITGIKHPIDFVQHLLHTEEITLNDICDWCDIDRDNGQKILSLFVRKHALQRSKLWYEKTSPFITLLKQMQITGIPKEALTEGDEF